MDEGEPWDWIPHTEGADRQKEINAYLSDMVERMPFAMSRKWVTYDEAIEMFGPPTAEPK